MNKTLLIGFLSVGFAAFVHADEQNPMLSHKEEVAKTKSFFSGALEKCYAKKFTGRKCASDVFNFAGNKKLDEYGCTVDYAAFDEIYKERCTEDLPHSPERCTVISKVYKNLKMTCAELMQIRKKTAV